MAARIVFTGGASIVSNTTDAAGLHHVAERSAANRARWQSPLSLGGGSKSRISICRHDRSSSQGAATAASSRGLGSAAFVE